MKNFQQEKGRRFEWNKAEMGSEGVLGGGIECKEDM